MRIGLRPILLVLLCPTMATLPPTAAAQGGDCPEYRRLRASDGRGFDLFGHSVGVSGPYAVVGSQLADSPGTDSGAAYVFDVLTGVQLFKLTPDDLEAFDWFGHAIAVDEGVTVVGSPGDDDEGTDAGAVYLFDTSTGRQTAKLLPGDGVPGAHFGREVAICGSLVVVGAPDDDDNGPKSGSAYVFNAASGQLVAKIRPSDGEPAERFGDRVAIAGTTVAIGASADDENGPQSGSAYLFDAISGGQLFKLLPSDGSSGDYFGSSVAISSTAVLIGARWNDDNGTDSGCAYVFDPTTGVELRKLAPLDGSKSDSFGIFAALDSSLALIGAWKDADNGNYAGSAYLFDTATGAELAKLSPSNSDPGDQFGWRVALNNRIGLVGMRDDYDHSNPGAAFLFDARACGGCLPDWDEDGQVTEADLPAFLTGWSAGDVGTDLNHDGEIDTRDVVRFLIQWAAGC